MKIRNFDICKSGIWFDYRGDVVLYVFPWKRERREWKFVSLLCEGVFPSLKSLNDFWDAYANSDPNYTPPKQKGVYVVEAKF